MDETKIKERAITLFNLIKEKGGDIFEGEKEKAFLEEWSNRLATRESFLEAAKNMEDEEVLDLHKTALENMLAQSENIAKMFELVKEKDWHDLLIEISKDVLSTIAKLAIGFI